MIELSLKTDFSRMEVALERAVGTAARHKAIATSLNRCVAAARRDVISRMPEVFDRPTPFTVRSVRYTAASADKLEASVFISDDATRGLSPRRYLQAEIEGGARRDKRSERAMKAMGVMAGDQQWVPGAGAPLNQFGNMPGAAMVTLMSRIGAFGQQGYRANATAATRRKLIRQGVAVTAHGFDFFVKRGKAGKPLGVYQLVSAATKATPGVKGSSARGGVRPVLIFIDRRATYKPRFHFTALVGDVVQKRWPEEMRRALLEGIR